MSRPKKSADGRRSRQVIFRLTTAEYARLFEGAERAGLPPNELARQFALNGNRHLVIHTHRRCDPAFLKRIEQIGHNLNQLVKNAHTFGRISPQIEPLCGEIKRLITEAINDTDNDC